MPVTFFSIFRNWNDSNKRCAAVHAKANFSLGCVNKSASLCLVTLIAEYEEGTLLHKERARCARWWRKYRLRQNMMKTNALALREQILKCVCTRERFLSRRRHSKCSKSRIPRLSSWKTRSLRFPYLRVHVYIKHTYKYVVNNEWKVCRQSKRKYIEPIYTHTYIYIYICFPYQRKGIYIKVYIYNCTYLLLYIYFFPIFHYSPLFSSFLSYFFINEYISHVCR